MADRSNEIVSLLRALSNSTDSLIQYIQNDGIPIIEQSSSATISPNVWNVWTSPVSNLTITKGTDTEDIVNEYMIKFTIDSNYDADDNQIAFSGWTNLTWIGGDAPTWVAGNTYEISIVDNIAVYTEIEPTVVP